jgi:hypothetical protein
MAETNHRADVHLASVDWLPVAARRRVRGALFSRDQERVKRNLTLARQLQTLKAEYGRDMSALMGRGAMRRYRELRKQLAKAPRSRRLLESNALLKQIQFDRVRAGKLRKSYLNAVRKLLLVVDTGRVSLPRPLLTDFGKSPWVIHTAPYEGYFWSYSWERSDEADDPVLARHLDHISGQTGSSISTRLSGADDDDFLRAEYYTAVNVWHTALATGPLEGYLAFAFRTSTYSGQVSDEFGFSSATYSQWARARFRILSSQGLMDTQESRVFNFISTDWGDGESWSNYVALPNDVHWYYFKTATSFSQGSTLLIEAGIWNMTWFSSNDESITTADDIDLRLDCIKVRSCPS